VPFKKGVIYHCRRVPSKPAGFYLLILYPDNNIEFIVCAQCLKQPVCRKAFGVHVILVVAIIFFFFIWAGNRCRGLLWLAN
jgi:hypothetical protein